MVDMHGHTQGPAALARAWQDQSAARDTVCISTVSMADGPWEHAAMSGFESCLGRSARLAGNAEFSPILSYLMEVTEGLCKLWQEVKQT